MKKIFKLNTDHSISFNLETILVEDEVKYKLVKIIDKIRRTILRTANHVGLSYAGLLKMLKNIEE